MNKEGAGSVFRRLFVLFCLVVLVIYLVITSLFVRYVQQERKTETANLDSRVYATTQLMEEQIRSVVNVQLQLFSDPRVAQLSLGLYSDAYERSQLILELLEYIENTQRINSIIEDIVISFPLEGMEISATDGFNRKDFSDPDAYHTNRASAEQLVFHEDRVELVLSYPLSLALDESYTPDFVIRCILSRDHMTGSIAPFRSGSHEGAFWLYRYGGEDRLLFSGEARDVFLRDAWLRGWEKDGMPPSWSGNARVGNVTYYVSSSVIEDYNLVLITYQDSNAIAWGFGKSLLNMTVVFLLMGVMFLMLVRWANRSVSKPLRKVMEAFEEVRRGRLSVRIYHKNQDEFGYIYASFNHMADRIEELLKNVREQEILVQRAERIQLQSQINPHFLYNSFYNIKFMARNGDYDQIETFVTALAKYYRFLNKETDSAISLGAEAEHMEHYIEIQQMRFGDKISVDIGRVPPEAASLRVPKLILQPIAENAYNYGLRDTLEGGKLWVRYTMEEARLRIEIGDNGGNMTPGKLEAMRMQMNTFSGEPLNHALTNIHRRLKLTFGDSCGLELSIGEEKGLCVTVVLDTDIRL